MLFVYVFVSVSAGNFWTQLYDEERDERLPASQDLRMFVEAKDPDDEVCPGHSRIYSVSTEILDFFIYSVLTPHPQ